MKGKKSSLCRSATPQKASVRWGRPQSATSLPSPSRLRGYGIHTSWTARASLLPLRGGRTRGVETRRLSAQTPHPAGYRPPPSPKGRRGTPPIDAQLYEKSHDSDSCESRSLTGEDVFFVSVMLLIPIKRTAGALVALDLCVLRAFSTDVVRPRPSIMGGSEGASSLPGS